MIPRIALLTAALLIPSAIFASDHDLESAARGDQGLTLPRCGTRSPTAAELEDARRALEQRRMAGELQGAGTGTIRVAFHVIHTVEEGNVTDTQIADQIAELNRNYAGTGYTFELASVDRMLSPGWFDMIRRGGQWVEVAAKRVLARDPARFLNLYTCGPGFGVLGWSFYPWDFPFESWALRGRFPPWEYMDGVVVHYGSLPGGNIPRYNLGRTASHEVGHYLGLLHTFENGCDAPGDLVEDTPYEAEPAFRCTKELDTCPQAGLDPIHNYMDYPDDVCLTEFTAGQIARMHEIVAAYRPLLFEATAIAPAASRGAGSEDRAAGFPDAIEMRPLAPNPFRDQTSLGFVLPRSERVTLRVHNVAGQLVRVLLDGDLAAGPHQARFRAQGLPGGLYFFTLSAGGRRTTRAAVLLD